MIGSKAIAYVQFLTEISTSEKREMKNTHMCADKLTSIYRF